MVKQDLSVDDILNAYLTEENSRDFVRTEKLAGIEFPGKAKPLEGDDLLYSIHSLEEKGKFGAAGVKAYEAGLYERAILDFDRAVEQSVEKSDIASAVSLLHRMSEVYAEMGLSAESANAIDMARWYDRQVDFKARQEQDRENKIRNERSWTYGFEGDE